MQLTCFETFAINYQFSPHTVPRLGLNDIWSHLRVSSHEVSNLFCFCGSFIMVSQVFSRYYKNRLAPSTDFSIFTVGIIAWYWIEQNIRRYSQQNRLSTNITLQYHSPRSNNSVLTNDNIVIKLTIGIHSRHHEHVPKRSKMQGIRYKRIHKWYYCSPRVPSPVFWSCYLVREIITHQALSKL